MRMLFFFLLCLFFAGSAEARRNSFGPNQGESVMTFEQKTVTQQQEVIEKLTSLEALLKQQQDTLTRQMQLIEQQNQFLNQIYQLQVQQLQQQQMVPQPQQPVTQQYYPAQ